MQDETNEEQLDRETWEALSVRLIGLGEVARLDLLERAEVHPDVYLASELHWAQVMHDEVVAGDLTNAMRYGARCAEAVERRKAEGPPAAEPVDEPSVDPPTLEPMPSPLHPAIPSYLQSPVAPPPRYVSPPMEATAAPAPAPAPKFTTLAGAVHEPRPTLPFVAPRPGEPGPAGAVPAPQPAAQRAPGGDPMDRTVEGPGIVLPPLPFAPKKGRP